MADVYTAFCVVYFVWIFVLFIDMVYVGVQDTLLSHFCSNKISVELRAFALATLIVLMALFTVLGHVLSRHTSGPLCATLPAILLVPATIAVHRGRKRVKKMRDRLEQGYQDGDLL